jgi:hypothetical protein
MNAEKLNWSEVTGGCNDRRLRLVGEIFDKLTPVEQAKVRLEECADEYTGARFGGAQKRRGRAAKVGGGGRNKSSAYAYQIWLVWA